MAGTNKKPAPKKVEDFSEEELTEQLEKLQTEELNRKLEKERKKNEIEQREEERKARLKEEAKDQRSLDIRTILRDYRITDQNIESKRYDYLDIVRNALKIEYCKLELQKLGVKPIIYEIISPYSYFPSAPQHQIIVLAQLEIELYRNKLMKNKTPIKINEEDLDKYE